ncbi:hypothetical protein D3C73_1335010 [compost metagenome]
MGEVGHGVGHLHVQVGTDCAAYRYLRVALEITVVPDAGQGHHPARFRRHDPGIGKHLLPGDWPANATLDCEHQRTTADQAQR